MLEKPRKKTLQERLREIEQDQEKQAAELGELLEMTTSFLYKEKPQLRLF